MCEVVWRQPGWFKRSRRASLANKYTTDELIEAERRELSEACEGDCHFVLSGAIAAFVTEDFGNANSPSSKSVLLGVQEKRDRDEDTVLREASLESQVWQRFGQEPPCEAEVMGRRLGYGRLVCTLSAGDCFGEPLRTGRPTLRAATVCATRNTELLVLDAPGFAYVFPDGPPPAVRSRPSLYSRRTHSQSVFFLNFSIQLNTRK